MTTNAAKCAYLMTKTAICAYFSAQPMTNQTGRQYESHSNKVKSEKSIKILKLIVKYHHQYIKF